MRSLLLLDIFRDRLSKFPVYALRYRKRNFLDEDCRVTSENATDRIEVTNSLRTFARFL